MSEKKQKAAPKNRGRSSKKSVSKGAKRCGLCGKTENLTKTYCCGYLICDDEEKYQLFSYARNSCFRNHDRYTLCSFHYNEGHEGNWRECQKCKKDLKTEMYVYYGTNEYNFVKLEDPPKYKPTKCAKCKKVIKLGEDGYSIKGKEYYCMQCAGLDLAKLFS
jgi:hypothetical protein